MINRLWNIGSLLLLVKPGGITAVRFYGVLIFLR